MLALHVACMLVAAQVDGASPPDDKPGLAVLPVDVRVVDDALPDASPLLTSLLTESVAHASDTRVIALDDVAVMLEAARGRQTLGCDASECITEIAGALGVRYVVASSVTREKNTLRWTASLLDDREATVVRRADVTGAALDQLVAQAQELAATVMGVQEQRQTAAQLGFASEQDARDFSSWRAAHRSLTMKDALTAYLIAHNTESPRLALAEATLFAGAAVLPALSGGLLVGGITVSMLGRFELGAVLMGLSLVATIAALVLGSAAAALTAIDFLDVGRVTVRRSGCCRNDADLVDAERDRRAESTAAMTMLLAGPLALGGFLVNAGIFVAVGITLASLYGIDPRIPFGYGDAFSALMRPVADVLMFLSIIAFFAIQPGAILCAPPLGLLAFLRPPRPVVDDDAAATVETP